jgi:2-oxoglutarate ferredoxin oxidoreductase subunit delta
MAKKPRRGKIVIDRERCKGCALCIPVCPQKVIITSSELNQKGYSPAEFKENPAEGEKGCTGCAMCATVCPEVAIEVYRAK